MAELIERSPAAKQWVQSALLRLSGGIFGKLLPAVIWTDARDELGARLVPIEAQHLVESITNSPYIFLHNHDPGKPKGQILEAASFETHDGQKFVVAILGCFAGGEVLAFQDLNLLSEWEVQSPQSLPVLPESVWIQIATDPREVDNAWLDSVTSDAPLRVERTELSHNAADSLQELIRVGLPYLVLVWNPFVTSIATEAGKDSYLAVQGWIRKLFEHLAERNNPILDIRALQGGCEVSFLIRGKKVDHHYAAHAALPAAAAQAAQLVAKLRERGVAGRELIYEFDGQALRWFPSYAVLCDGRIVTDNSELIAIEQLPTSLSLGFTPEPQSPDV
ncbi:hypothetical protein [Pseudomonas sp. Gutcm_11s]|uniref:hypothetical protein n=1 Tax=Pseudomonas sp. Gutcm_11s TaxID=3026088 RepID=UPI002360CE8F|nr:hypothetical protein [Pseudomonas sp. Gutcm_11s]MDD0842103.1 hypothetical protein [Pseudomonas sp. Gutcm_11s]